MLLTAQRNYKVPSPYTSWKLGETKHMYASLTEAEGGEETISRSQLIAMPLFDQSEPRIREEIRPREPYKPVERPSEPFKPT